MANLTKNEKYIVDMYVRYFGKAPSKAEIAKYNDFKTPKEILTEIRGEADDSKAGLTTEEFVNNAFQNLFGRNATTKEMNKYSKVVDAGKDLPINAIVKSAKKADKGVYEAKKAIAIMLAEDENTTNYNLDKITKDTYANVYNLKTKKLLVDSVAQLETKIDAMPDNVSGTTFVLTTSTDNFVGKEKGDIFVGSVSATAAINTLNAVDRIDGGAGIDTLKVSDEKGTVVVPNMSNIEIIEVSGFDTANLNVDTTATTGVTDLNIIKAASAINADAGSTTNVTVNMKAAGKAVDIDGGKDVTVKLTDVAGAADIVSIGTDTDGAGADLGVAAAGNVVVDMTGKAATASATLSAVEVTGGKTISVTQKATSDSSKATTDTTGITITQGAVGVIGNKDTTTVTVKQDAAVAQTAAVVGVAGKAATQSVEFTGAKKGDIIKLDFGDGELTFTAKTDLTAAQVASAFANLAAGAKQGSASATLGLYTDATGGVTNGWTSGAVETVSSTVSKVVFSTMTDSNAGAAGIQAGAITTAVTPVATSTVSATASAVTAGTTAVTAKAGVMGVANGIVTINDIAAATIKTITVDGYANSSVIGTTTATTVLETLNLSNASGSASMTVADTAATLALTVEKLGSVTTAPTTGAVTTTAAVVTLLSAPTTLNVTSTGNNIINLTAALTETLNVNGTGLLDISATDLAALKTVVVSGTAGLSLNAGVANTVTSVNTTATTGTVTTTIDATAATYTGGAGNDIVTIGTTATKAIDLGNGDNKLTLVGTVTVPTVEIKAGTGTKDTIAMAAASAASLTASDKLFADKISGFEKLEVGVIATGVDTTTVKLDNMDAINYVVSKGHTDGVGIKAIATLDIADTALTATQTLSIGGVVAYTATGAASDANIATALNNTTITIGGVVYDITAAGTVLTLKAQTAAVVSTIAAATVSGGTPPTATTVTVNTAGTKVTGLVLDKMLANATAQLDATGNVEVKLAVDTGLTDVVNFVANANGALGTVKAANVETINITTNDTDLLRTEVVTGGVSVVTENVSTSILSLDANKAATINLYGAGNLTLTLAAADTAVTLIDASAATGKIVVSTLAGDLAATTVKGGSAADTITLAGANDVAIGGAGNDTLIVTTAAAATLTGGDGVDKFDVSGFKGSVGGAATITDFTKGESIKFISSANADFNSGKVTLISESTFTEYVNEAMKAASANSTLTNGISWFQFNGNTFIAQNIGADNTFNDGTDILVKITGLVDLSASSFNEVGEGTLLFV